MKVRENMGPLSHYILQTIGNLEILADANVMKNHEISNDEKLSTPFICYILQGTVSTPFPRQYLAKYSRKKLSYTEIPVLS